LQLCPLFDALAGCPDALESNLRISLCSTGCEIEVLLPCAMSNHYHVVIYDRVGRYPEFIEHFRSSSLAARMHCGPLGELTSNIATQIAKDAELIRTRTSRTQTA
jgi:hypothetical protein